MSALTCNYLVYDDDRKPRECGAPATLVLNQLTRAGHRLFYCDAHGRHVRTVGRQDVREIPAHLKQP